MAASHKGFPTATGDGDGAPHSKNKRHCTVPIAAIFALGCLIVIAAFTAVSTYSGVKFSQNVKGAVDDNLELALRGAIQAIRSPLDESRRYSDRLHTKIENQEAGYPLDDLYPSSLAPQSAFYTDAMMTAHQRPEISSIYQVRRSSRYEHSPGSPVDTVALVIMPNFQLIKFANNTGTLVGLSSLKDLSNISALPFFSIPLNVSGSSYIEVGLATVGIRWVTGVLVIPGIISTRISLLSQVNVSGSSWTVCIDHNMTIFRDLMKQATAPFSIGITNPAKAVANGAHTSLYDLNGGVLMSTSIDSFDLHTNASALWPAGGTPSEDINAAYAHAIAACPPSSTACTTDPNLLVIDGRLVGAMRLREGSSGLDLLLVSSVPREHFFREADKVLAVSIGVAVACCVAIVAGCIAVLVAIGPALRRLQENMMLASVLQNHLVEHTASRLTDIAKLSAVFDEMNQRLLIARSFVPEAVLLGEDDADEEDASDTSHVETNVVSENSRRVSRVRSGGTNRSSVFQRSMLHREQDRASSHASRSTEAQDSTLVGRPFTMNEKRVAVLSLNMVGFNGLVAERGGTRALRVNDVSSKLLSIVVEAAQRERGVMDSFHGDHFVLTFNASRAVASALTAAIRTANVVAEDVRRDLQLRGCMGVAAGAAIGKSLVGTLGIDGHRRLSIVGHAYRQAIALQAVSSQFIQKTALQGHRNVFTSTGCVVEETALREIGDCGLYMQLIGRAVPPVGARNQTATRVYAAHAHTKRHGHTKSATKSITADEWLYELDAIQAGDPFTDPNAALEALMSGNPESCNQMLTANDCGVQTPSFHGAVSCNSSSDAFGLEASRNSVTNAQLKVGWGAVEALYRQHAAGGVAQETVLKSTLSPDVSTTTTTTQQQHQATKSAPSELLGSNQQHHQCVWEHILY